MAEIGNIFVRIGAKIDDFEAAMRKVGDSIKKAEDRFSGLHEVGKRLSDIGVKVAAAGAAIGAGLGLAVKTAADFDAQMSKVQALSGATEEDFKRLRDAAIELGAKTVYSASEAAEGMQILAAAGFDTNQIIAAMPGLLNAAAAAGENFGTVADIMVAAMSGFGLQAQDMAHIADVLASAANASAISITDIGYSLKYVAPVARTAGISLEEVSAALAILGNAGIKADKAGTTLRMALIRLADPPKEAAAMLQQLGIQITDASGKMLPFQQIIAQLHDKFSGLSQAQKIQAAATIFGAEAMSGMLTLIEAGPEQLGALTTEFQNSSGAAQQMADTMTNNLAGAIEQLKGSLESAFIAIGTALTPAIQSIVQHLQKLVDWFNNLPDPVKQGIAVFGALSAVVLVVGGTFLVLVGNIMQAIATIATLGPLFTGLAAPIGVAIAAVTAFIAIGVALYRNWDEISAWLGQVWETIKQFAINIWNSIASFLTSVWNGIASAAQSIWNGFVSFITGLWNGLVSVASTIWETLKTVVVTIVQGFVNAVVGFFVWLYNHNYYFEALVNFIVNAFNWLKTTATAIWNAISAFFSAVWNGIKSVATSVWNAIVVFLSSIWNGIKTTASTVWNTITNIITTLFNSAKNTVVSIATGILNSVRNTWNSITNTISSVGSKIKDAIIQPFNSAKSLVSNVISSAYNWGKNLIGNIVSGIKSMIGSVTSAVKSVASTISRFLGFHSPAEAGPGKYADEWMPNLMKMLQEGVEKNIPRLQATLNTALKIPVASSPALVTANGINIELPAMQTNTMPQIVIEQMVVRNDNDIERIAQRLWQLQQSRLRGQGR